MCVRVGDHVTPLDLADLRRSAGLKESDEVRANDFLLAMMIRLGKHTTFQQRFSPTRVELTWAMLNAPGYINPDDTKNIRKLFAKLDVNQSGCLCETDAVEYVENAASGATKKSRRAQSREHNVFDTDEEAAAVRPTSTPALAVPPTAKTATSSESNPIAAGAGVKKAGMVLGEETTGDKVRGADGKVRRKVKKPKKSNDEV